MNNELYTINVQYIKLINENINRTSNNTYNFYFLRANQIIILILKMKKKKKKLHSNHLFIFF